MLDRPSPPNAGASIGVAIRRAVPESRRRWILCLRLGLGVLLMATGIGKLLDVAGFIAVIGTYQLNLGPTTLALAAWTVVALELLLGLWLVVSPRPMAAAVGATGLNLGYMALLVDALRRGLRLPNCGCFGVYLPSPLTWLSPLESLATAALCGLLWHLIRQSAAR